MALFSKKNSLIILACVCLINIISVFQQCYPSILSYDIEKSLNLSQNHITLISGYTLLSFGLCQIPIGILTDKFGPKLILILFQFAVAFCTFLFIFTDSIQTVLLSRILVGVFLSALVPGMKILAMEFEPYEFSKASSILLSTGALGSLLASTPLAFLSSTIGWRYSLGILACISLFCAISLIFLPLKKVILKEKNGFSFKSLKTSILTNKNFIFLFFWYLCIFGVTTCMANLWNGRYIVQGLGFSTVNAGHILFSMAIICIIGMPFWAYIGEKVIKSEKKTMLLGSSIHILLFFYIAFFSITNFWELIIVFTALNFFGPSVLPLCITACKRNVPLENFATANGVLVSSAPLFGSLFQFLFGYILILSGPSELNPQAYSNSFLLMAIITTIGLVSLFFYNEKKAKV